MYNSIDSYRLQVTHRQLKQQLVQQIVYLTVYKLFNCLIDT
jgi:hypothetical protein